MDNGCRGGRVLHVISSLQVGGAETFLANLVGVLRRAGWQSEVIALSPEGPLRAVLEAEGCVVHSPEWRIGRLPRAADLRNLARLARHVDADVIHGWMAHGNLAALVIRALMPERRAALVWAIHQSIEDLSSEKPSTRVLIRLASWMSRFPEMIVNVSQASLLQHAALGFAGDSAVFIPNGIDTGRFTPMAHERRAVRAEFGIPADAFVVGHIGRAHPQKDYHTLGLALQRVLAHDADVHALLVGKGLEAANPDFVRAFGEVALDARVHFAGQRMDVARILSGVDVLCLSSSYGEAFPLVLLEAMACGVPCVTTDVGDSAAIVGGLGWVVSPSSPAELADALREARAVGASVAQRAAVRQRVLDAFSLTGACDRYISTYRGAMDERSRANADR